MDKAEELLQRRLMDLSERAVQKGIVTFSDFLNLHELNILHNSSQKFSGIQWKTFGGYELAERQIAAFIPDALYYDWEYPIACLRITPLNERFSDSLSHRDYLGAVLNLGIDRSKLGDILVEEKCAYLFCTEKMSDYIITELSRIKHTSTLCSRVAEPRGEITLRTETISGTVASVRLDSVMSVAFRTSRSSLVKLIEGGKVFINGRLAVSNGYNLKENDIISVRGLGKLRYTGTRSQSKKGRLYIEVEKYI